MLAPYDKRRDRDGSWIVLASMIALAFMTVLLLIGSY